MKTIKFQHNWNRKLDCDVFTTIRRHTQDKEEYYLHSVGEEFDILLNGVTYCYARLENMYCDRLINTPNAMLMVDTGATSADGAYEVFGRFGLNGDSQVIVLTLIRKREALGVSGSSVVPSKGSMGKDSTQSPAKSKKRDVNEKRD